MNPVRFRPKTFGLCLVAALGLMAFMAAGAQAEWRVLGTAITTNQNIEIGLHKAGKLSVPAKELEIECTATTSNNSKLIAEASLLLILIVVELRTCTTFLGGVASPACKPKEPIVVVALGHLILHGSPAKNYILVEPDPPATRFARVEFIAGCALPATNVAGSTVIECLTEALGASDCATERVNQLVREVPGVFALFGEQLSYGANPMTLSSIDKAKLTTTNVGCSWGGKI